MLSYTHINGHMLDLVIGHSSSNLVKSVNDSDMLTDHSAIHCRLHLRKAKYLKREIISRKLNNIDHVAFAEDVAKKSDLILNPEATNLDRPVNQYNTVLLSILNKHAPLCKRIVTDRPRLPWFNDEIKAAKQYRKKMEQKWRKSGYLSDRNLFKAQRNHVTNLIDNAKSQYYKDKIDNCKSDQKALFHVVEQLLHNKRCSQVTTT